MSQKLRETGALLDQIIFVGTGILSTAAAQLLLNAGAGDAWTQLLPLSNYSGMMLAGGIPKTWYMPAGSTGGGSGHHLSLPDKARTTSDPAVHLHDSLADIEVGSAACASREGAELVRRAQGEESVSGASGGASSSSAAHPSSSASASATQQQEGGSEAEGLLSSKSSFTPSSSATPTVFGVPLTVNGYVLCAICLDTFGFYLHVQGLEYAGSAVFQVLYASVVVWAALGTRVIRGPVASLHPWQWLGIVVVMTGLGVSARGETGHAVNGSGGKGTSSEQEDAAVQLALRVWGVLVSLACAVTYGLQYCLAEVLMSGREGQGTDPAVIATKVGGGISALLSTYVLIYVLPHWGKIVATVEAAGRMSWPMVAAGYVTMMVSAAAHAITYYRCMGSTGATAVGLMQAARAIGVFLISSMLFCTAGASAPPPGSAHSHAVSQCFTLERGLATVLVCAGIYVFSIGKAAKVADKAAAGHGASSPTA